MLVFVHGGAWQRGDKEAHGNINVGPTLSKTTESVVVSINYRLSPDVKYPEHIRDVATALHWIRLNIHTVRTIHEQVA